MYWHALKIPSLSEVHQVKWMYQNISFSYAYIDVKEHDIKWLNKQCILSDNVINLYMNILLKWCNSSYKMHSYIQKQYFVYSWQILSSFAKHWSLLSVSPLRTWLQWLCMYYIHMLNAITCVYTLNICVYIIKCIFLSCHFKVGQNIFKIVQT
jgi:hypothetical protein